MIWIFGNRGQEPELKSDDFEAKEAEIIRHYGLDPDDPDDVDHFYMLEREAEAEGREFEFRPNRLDMRPPQPGGMKAG